MKSEENENPDFLTAGDPLKLWINYPPHWRKYTLWELATYINGRAFKPTDFTPEGAPVIKITELKRGISNTTAHYCHTVDDKYRLQNGDILFAWSGNPETSIDVFRWYENDGILNQHIFRVIPKNIITPDYLYYVLKFLKPIFIRTARDKATSMGHVKIADLKRLVVYIPTVAEQAVATKELSLLDQKIALNIKAASRLESLANVIFRSWFIDFDAVHAKAAGQQPYGMDTETASFFPDTFEDPDSNEIPSGWNMTTLGKLVEFAYGKPLKEEDRQPGLIPVYGSNGVVGYHNQPLCDAPGIVVGRKGNAGTVVWACDPFFPIDTTFYIRRLDENIPLIYHFFMLKYLNLASLGSDSAVPGLNRNMAYLSPYLKPDYRILAKFDGLCACLQRQIDAINKENIRLGAIRDSLIPHIILGGKRLDQNHGYGEAASL